MHLDANVPVKPTIKPELLRQLDIRVGTIETVSNVPDSDKLVEPGWVPWKFGAQIPPPVSAFLH